jgi:hypothetical protein
MRNYSRNTKKRLIEELDKIAQTMTLTEDPEELKRLRQRYEDISSVLQSDWKISPDTVVIVASNLLGILIILNFEKLDVISTKALGFVMRGRV